MKHTPIEEAGQFDCVVITTDHRNVDYAALVERAQLVVDTRNATRAVRAQVPGQDRVAVKENGDPLGSPLGTIARSCFGLVPVEADHQAVVLGAEVAEAVAVEPVADAQLDIEREVVGLHHLDTGGAEQREAGAAVGA